MKLQYNLHDEDIEFISSEDALFHFTKKDTAIEHILINKSLRLGAFAGTNDPQEYKSKMTGAIGWGWEEHHTEKVSKVTSLIDEILRKDTKFISFCKNHFNDGILSSHGLLKSRMWSQYADNHRGICIVVSKSKLIDHITEKYGQTHAVCTNDVIYEEPDLRTNVPCLDIDGDALDLSAPYDVAGKFIQEFRQPLLFTKQPDYKDENEFRTIAIAPEGQNSEFLYIDLTKCIHSIILGDAFPKVYKPTIKQLADELGIPFKKLHWEHHAYVLLNWDSKS